MLNGLNHPIVYWRCNILRRVPGVPLSSLRACLSSCLSSFMIVNLRIQTRAKCRDELTDSSKKLIVVWVQPASNYIFLIFYSFERMTHENHCSPMSNSLTISTLHFLPESVKNGILDYTASVSK